MDAWSLLPMSESKLLVQDWDTFRNQQPQALFTHGLSYVSGLAATYHHSYHLLTARKDNGQLAGILPLLVFAAPGEERRLISLPYSDAAGLLADSPEAAKDLLIQGLDLAARLGCQHLELRQAGGEALSLPERYASGWRHHRHTFKIGLARALPDHPSGLWAGLSDKVRNQVRKARRSGSMARVGGTELLGDFWAVFSENMRDLGSPVHDFQLFARLLGEASLGAELVVVFLAGEAAAAAMVFRQGETMFNPWAASLRRLRPTCPNMLLYWTMLELAIVRGCRIFDFGRSSPDSPAHRFKRQWGAEAQPLSWQVFSQIGSNWQPRRESLSDPAWMSLPLAESRRRGPSVRRWISL